MNEKVVIFHPCQPLMEPLIILHVKLPLISVASHNLLVWHWRFQISLAIYWEFCTLCFLVNSWITYWPYFSVFVLILDYICSKYWRHHVLCVLSLYMIFSVIIYWITNPQLHGVDGNETIMISKNKMTWCIWYLIPLRIMKNMLKNTTEYLKIAFFWVTCKYSTDKVFVYQGYYS